MTSPSATSTLDRLNLLSTEDLAPVLLAVCASPAWARGVGERRPFRTAEDLYRAAADVLEALTEIDVDDALAGHPRIGDRAAAAHSASSAREQAGVSDAQADVLRGLAEGNAAYEERFGHVYLVCASGRTAAELLAVLRSRLGNDPQTERAVLRRELAAINRIRLERLLLEGLPDRPADGPSDRLPVRSGEGAA